MNSLKNWQTFQTYKNTAKHLYFHPYQKVSKFLHFIIFINDSYSLQYFQHFLENITTVTFYKSTTILPFFFLQIHIHITGGNKSEHTFILKFTIIDKLILYTNCSEIQILRKQSANNIKYNEIHPALKTHIIKTFQLSFISLKIVNLFKSAILAILGKDVCSHSNESFTPIQIAMSNNHCPTYWEYYRIYSCRGHFGTEIEGLGGWAL